MTSGTVVRWYGGTDWKAMLQDLIPQYSCTDFRKVSTCGPNISHGVSDGGLGLSFRRAIPDGGANTGVPVESAMARPTPLA
eukprot:8544800-Pyramimonas_sp.AAC.2